MCSGVFEVRQCATQGLHGDNRRTGVKMDWIEVGGRRIPMVWYGMVRRRIPS